MVKTKFARRLLRYSRLQGTRPVQPSGENKKLTSNDNPGRHVAQAQAAGHGQGHDYDKGSPHLRHRQLRTMVEERLTRMVRDVIAVNDTCQVVEIGAGHGRFTAALLAAGARVTVTETSRASADGLEQAYSTDSRVTVLFDETGEGVLGAAETWDAAVMVSVVHHIPDYVDFIERLSRKIVPGGAFFTVQDPLYYPRMSPWAHRVDRAAYLSWRLLQGDYAQGMKTRARRLRGVYDSDEPSDLVEYHVVRDGVDELAIRELLEQHFGSVHIFDYWSSQAPMWQWLGEKLGLKSTFGAEARRRIPISG